MVVLFSYNVTWSTPDLSNSENCSPEQVVLLAQDITK